MKFYFRSFLVTGISAMLASAFMPLTLQAQENLDIPLPSEVQPDRIRIPIGKAQEMIQEGETGEATDDEIAAFAIAANGNGWIPPNSSGWLRKGMMVRVTVMVQGNMEHSTEPQRINHSGKIGLPLLKNVSVGNSDLEKTEEDLTRMYETYYKEPLVNIEFVGETTDPNQSPWGYVTIMGQVANAGPLAMPPTQNLTISGAIKLAGGFSGSANKGSIRIFRPQPQEESVEVIKVDLDALASKGRAAEDVRLRAGDVVFIRERIF
ncbi:polysaccharide biosynthesis/export family protein [Kiritimatiellaeota bacterium B1221]|nr:polysaccharide biosynthesis/export family protein [Kiritimatiellaeota bacterium B1221]